MTEPVTVTGGAGGIVAELEDLQALVILARSAADSVRDVTDDLRAPWLRWLLVDGADRDPAGFEAIAQALTALVGLTGSLPQLEAGLESVAGRLLGAVRDYQGAEDSVFDSITQALGHAFSGSVDLLNRRFAAGGREMFDALPGLTDLALGGAGPLGLAYAAAIPDGHPVLHDLGADTRPEAAVAPRTLTDLITGLALRNGGRNGEISVSWVRSPDGRRRAIVDVPGTKSWDPAPNHDVTSVGTDVVAMAGRDTAYEEGVFLALGAAGVGPHDDVLLVGHSEGGIVAVNAARDAARSGRFHVTHVVTAGSPVGRIARGVPDGVQVLALENAADVVPHADGASNPDRPNITTVTVRDQRYSITGNHDVGTTYERAATAADLSGDGSVDGFLSSAEGFLTGTTLDTHSFRITRAF